MKSSTRPAWLDRIPVVRTLAFAAAWCPTMTIAIAAAGFARQEKAGYAV
jgi:hypothetical protein